MKKIALILLAGSMLMLNSCTKKGDRGPIGPQGNANVQGSNGFNVNSWALNTTENAYEASFTDPDITQAVSDRGVVQIFLFYPSDGTWRNLPDIYSGSQFYFRYNTGGFDIYFGNVDGTTPSFPTGTWTFRSVVITPSNKLSHPNTNWKNYNEAMAALNSSNNSSSATQ